VAPEESRDLLEDLAAVMGDEDITAANLPALLARYAPRWAPYRTPPLTGKDLVAQLAELGVKVPSTGNRWLVSPDLIREGLARRAAAEDGEMS
jgi:S-DNA-T family DNA segregation ATPase FtsK/SpoIIIE